MIVSHSDFPLTQVNTEGVAVTYVNLTEINQGGPEIGNLKVNDVVLKEYWFGGPLLFWQNYAVAPVLERSRFRFSLVNLDTLQVTLLVHTYDLILLSEIRDGHALFYVDLQNSDLREVDLENSEIFEKLSFRDFLKAHLRKWK